MTKKPWLRGLGAPPEIELPEGNTCSDCFYFEMCDELYGHVPEDEICDWAPSKFLLKEEADRKSGGMVELIPQSFEIIGPVDGMDILRRIEAAGRICYKSEARITETSARKFVKTILDSGHHSVIEHCNVSARIVTNRGVTHELVRHRLAAYSQESTRYVDYGHRNMLFIEPVWWPQADIWQRYTFGKILKHCAAAYKHLLDLGWAPQQAREVLPNGLKTEIVMTGNLREWRHVFSLRCSKAAHPQMRELMLEGLRKFSDAIPVLFDDLKERYLCEESSIISEPASTNGTA